MRLVERKCFEYERSRKSVLDRPWVGLKYHVIPIFVHYFYLLCCSPQSHPIPAQCVLVKNPHSPPKKSQHLLIEKITQRDWDWAGPVNVIGKQQRYTVMHEWTKVMLPAQTWLYKWLINEALRQRKQSIHSSAHKEGNKQPRRENSYAHASL